MVSKSRKKFSLGSLDSIQEISINFEQNLRLSSCFCDLPIVLRSDDFKYQVIKNLFDPEVK